MTDYKLSLVEEGKADPFILPVEMILDLECIREENDKKTRAHKLFEYLVKKIRYNSDYPRQRNALEVFAEGKGNCIEQSFLYVTAARYLGIDSQIAFVNKDDCGKEVSHACSAIFLNETLELVDLTYGKFGIRHQSYDLWNDDRVRKERKCFVKKVISPRTVKEYNLGDIIEYLYDFQDKGKDLEDMCNFYENVDCLEKNLLDLGISANVDFLRKRKEEIDIYKVHDIEKIYFEKVDDKTVYDIGKNVRKMLDIEYFDNIYFSTDCLMFLKHSLPPYLNDAYNENKINNLLSRIKEGNRQIINQETKKVMESIDFMLRFKFRP
jgi:hypothetical protein